MSTIIINQDWDIKQILSLVGIDNLDPDAYVLHSNTLSIDSVSQTDLDNAVSSYDHNAYIATQPLRDWIESIASSPMNRNREDHIKDVLGGVADSPAEQAIYDAKILLRGNKPI